MVHDVHGALWGVSRNGRRWMMQCRPSLVCVFMRGIALAPLDPPPAVHASGGCLRMDVGKAPSRVGPVTRWSNRPIVGTGEELDNLALCGKALVSSHSVHTNEAGAPDRIRTPHTVALWGWAITRAKYLRGTASPPTSMSYCIPSALLVSASRAEMTGPRALGAAQCGLIFTSHIRGPLNPRRPFVQGRRSSFKYKQGYGLLQDTNRHVSIIVDFLFLTLQ